MRLRQYTPHHTTLQHAVAEPHALCIRGLEQLRIRSLRVAVVVLKDGGAVVVLGVCRVDHQLPLLEVWEVCRVIGQCLSSEIEDGKNAASR